MYGLAAYVVLRPLSTGALSIRVLRFARSASGSRWYAGERSQAARLQVSECEARVFDHAGLRAPPDATLVLVVKACLAGPAAGWRCRLLARLRGRMLPGRREHLRGDADRRAVRLPGGLRV